MDQIEADERRIEKLEKIMADYGTAIACLLASLDKVSLPNKVEEKKNKVKAIMIKMAKTTREGRGKTKGAKGNNIEKDYGNGVKVIEELQLLGKKKSRDALFSESKEPIHLKEGEEVRGYIAKEVSLENL